MKLPAILKNKYVLYILLIVAIVNVLGYLAMEDYKSLGLFISISSTLSLIIAYGKESDAINSGIIALT